jgi:hypothetical protein
MSRIKRCMLSLFSVHRENGQQDIKFITTVFWGVMPCSLVDSDNHFRRTWYLHLQGRSDICYPEDDGSKFFRNVPSVQWGASAVFVGTAKWRGICRNRSHMVSLLWYYIGLYNKRQRHHWAVSVIPWRETYYLQRSLLRLYTECHWFDSRLRGRLRILRFLVVFLHHRNAVIRAILQKWTFALLLSFYRIFCLWSTYKAIRLTSQQIRKAVAW